MKLNEELTKICTLLQDRHISIANAVNQITSLIVVANSSVLSDEWEMNNELIINNRNFICTSCKGKIFSIHKEDRTKIRCQGCNAIYSGGTKS